jgi:hypothetical protein
MPRRRPEIAPRLHCPPVIMDWPRGSVRFTVAVGDGKLSGLVRPARQVDRNAARDGAATREGLAMSARAGERRERPPHPLSPFPHPARFLFTIVAHDATCV